MASKKREKMRLIPRGDAMVVHLGEMEIWDGADLALLRETLTLLMDEGDHEIVGISMSHVKYIPSGFFGMLCDWHDRGKTMYLYSPQPNVARMLWFRQFFEHVGDDCFALTYVMHENQKMAEPLEYAADNHWTTALPDDEDSETPPAAFPAEQQPATPTETDGENSHSSILSNSEH